MKKTYIYNIIAVAICLIPMILGIYLNGIQSEGMFKHTQFHIDYVIASSFISMLIGIMAYIEFHKNKQLDAFYLCVGFIGITIFYGFHGLVTPGNSIFAFANSNSQINAFVFFGDLSRAWFALMLFIPRLIKSKEVKFYNKRVIFIVCTFIIATSLFLIYNPQLFPSVKDLLGKDTAYAILIKFFTLTLLGVSAVNYFESYRIVSKLQTLTLLLGVILLMQAVIIFLTSVPWRSTWWLAHNLYLMTFITIGYGILLSIKDKKYQYFNVWSEVTDYIQEIVNKKERLENKVTDLSYYASHDYLTGLYNRSYFMKFLRSSIEKAKESKETFGVLFIDLDGFKEVNDEYGHDVGDQLLIVISKIFTDCIREVDVVSRFGGDEFSIFLYNIDRKDIIEISKRILSSLSDPIIINEHKCMVGASIGISMFPEDGDAAQVLINKSDISMYMVKKNGKNNFLFYKEEIEAIQ